MNPLRMGGLLCIGWLAIAPALCTGQETQQKHEGEQPGDPSAGEPSPALGFTPCRNGHADVYPCRNVDLASYMPLEALGAEPNENAAGIWGWTDAETRHE